MRDFLTFFFCFLWNDNELFNQRNCAIIYFTTNLLSNLHVCMYVCMYVCVCVCVCVCMYVCSHLAMIEIYSTALLYIIVIIITCIPATIYILYIHVYI